MRKRTTAALVAALMLLAASASAQTVKHRYQSARPDDPTKEISSGEWNDSHLFAGGADENLMCRDTGATDGWAWCTVNDFTADGTPDGAADYVLTWDASASGHKKVLLDDLPGGGGGTPGGSSGDIQTNDGAGGFGAYAGDGCTVGNCVTDIGSDGTVTCGACSAGAGSTLVRKTANESVTSSVTLQDDDHLSFAVAANEKWQFDLVLFVDGATNGDIKLAIVGPTGTSGFWAAVGPALSLTTVSASNTSDVVTNASNNWSATPDFSFGTVPPDPRTMIRIYGVATIGGTAGTVKLQWAQNASSATPTNIFASSYLIYRSIS